MKLEIYQKDIMSSNLPSSFKPRGQPQEKKPASFKPKQADLPKSFQPIQKKEKEEGMWKSLARTAYQIPSGIAQAVTYPMDLIQMMGIGEAIDPEEIERLEEISKREGVPFDKEKYLQSAQEAAETFPTQSNIERGIEAKTGLPLTAKTRLQKGLKFASSAGKFTPGNLTQKLSGAGIASGLKEGAQQLGVPEPLAEAIGLGVGPALGSKVPSVAIQAAKKPSGLPTRQYEKLKSPRQVSAGKVEKIHGKLESDFKKIADDIISTAPIEKTRATLKENPAFKQEVAQKFRDVETLAESLPEKISTNTVKKTIVDNALKKKGTGFAPGEYDKDYRKFMLDFLKDTPEQEIGAGDLVAQYRKNNKALSEYYDPSHSRAYNRAKKDALLDYNRAIAETIEKEYPNSEFSNLFKETNKQWSEISDAESIESFIDGLFEKGPNYQKGKRFFESENQARPFKRALGEENFQRFEQLMKDMISTEQPAKMLKIARSKGFGELAETAGAFILHPTVGKAKLAYSAAKKAYNGLIDALLDKPQLTVTWKQAVDDLKKGNFAKADKGFKDLKGQVEVLEKEKAQPSMFKEPETIEAKAERVQEPKRLEAPRKQIEGPKPKIEEKPIEAKPKTKPEKPKKKTSESQDLSDYAFQQRIDAFEAGGFKEQANKLRKEQSELKSAEAKNKELRIKEIRSKMVKDAFAKADRLEKEAIIHEKQGNITLAKTKRRKAKQIREFYEEMAKD